MPSAQGVFNGRLPAALPASPATLQRAPSRRQARDVQARDVQSFNKSATEVATGAVVAAPLPPPPPLPQPLPPAEPPQQAAAQQRQREQQEQQQYSLGEQTSSPPPSVGSGIPLLEDDSDDDGSGGDGDGRGSEQQEQQPQQRQQPPPPASGNTQLIFKLERRGEGWAEEILPHLVLEQRPLEAARGGKKRAYSRPDPWQVGCELRGELLLCCVL